MSSNQKPKIIQYNADYQGCGFWRFLWPQHALNMSGMVEIHHSHLFIRDPLHYAQASVIHIQRQVNRNQYEFFKKLAHLRDRLEFRLVYDTDDITFREDIPIYNPFRRIYISDEVREFQPKIMELCDEVTVSTPYLREYLLNKTSQKKISVVPNFIPYNWMGSYYSEEQILSRYRKNKERPKILYSGSSSHFDTHRITDNERDDFFHVRDMIIETRNEFEWIFVGSHPPSISPYLRSGEMQYFSWKNLIEYPQFLSSLGCSMAVAPLMENDFNRAKSDIKFLEAAALGLPIACQDMCTYAIAPIRFKTGKEMIEKIRDTLRSEESLIDAARAGRKLLEYRWLENKDNLGKFLDLYHYSYGDPRRMNL